MSTRRHVLVGGAGLAASTVALGFNALLPSRGQAVDRPPNVVVITADDLGYGELGAYGQRTMRTPRLDRLCAEGLRFTQAYSAAPVCAPSRCSLLTGLHSGHSAVRHNPSNGRQDALDPDQPTFAEVLRARGYRTACVGKWGFGGEAADDPSRPNARGFDEFYGYVTHRHARDHMPDHLWHDDVRRPVEPGSYAPDLFEERALDFLRRQVTARRRFLLYLSPSLPHAPSAVPPAEAAASAYRDRPWSPADRAHATQIARLDRMVGAVTDELRRLGVHRDTLVLFTSDNGPHEEDGTDPDLFDANGPLRGYKRNLYEGGIRVPLVAWRPGTVVGGTVSQRVTPLIDVLPTLAELAGGRTPKGIDGRSAAALLGAHGEAAEHDHLYWFRGGSSATPRANAVDAGRAGQLAEAVRRGDWKAVRFAPGRDRRVPDERWALELYDLAADPGETTDVAARHPAVVAELTGLMRACWTDVAR
ncbi:arylsulfatase [Streptomyces sp. B6B3]|uniref:arylsulfatase n=1 Tax=Streptomyces sp. B6B3 TaxID=3153570 RepID=UPI00325E381A